MIESNDVKEIQIKIKRQIEELEEKVKNSKTYWNCSNLKFDKQFVQNFIEGHYNEIVHHLNQIKHHLEKVNYHKNEIEDIQLYLVHEPKSSSLEVLNDSDEHIEDKAPKRSEEDKIRLKSRRLARSTSLKYVLQWEKMLDEQKEENASKLVKKRSKNITNGTEPEDAKSEEDDVSKVMVKNRVMQFEGIQKPKRISSTYETFLDFSGEKPKRVKSYPILEEIEDEKGDNNSERPKSCTLDDSSHNFEHIDKSSKNDVKEPENNELPKVSENLQIQEHEESKTIKNEEKGSRTPELEHSIKEVHEGIIEQERSKDKRLLEEETPTIQNLIASGDGSRKPRIVEVHLKQPYVTETNPQVPLV